MRDLSLSEIQKISGAINQAEMDGIAIVLVSVYLLTGFAGIGIIYGLTYSGLRYLGLLGFIEDQEHGCSK